MGQLSRRLQEVNCPRQTIYLSLLRGGVDCTLCCSSRRSLQTHRRAWEMNLSRAECGRFTRRPASQSVLGRCLGDTTSETDHRSTGPISSSSAARTSLLRAPGKRQPRLRAQECRDGFMQDWTSPVPKRIVTVFCHLKYALGGHAMSGYKRGHHSCQGNQSVGKKSLHRYSVCRKHKKNSPAWHLNAPLGCFKATVTPHEGWKVDVSVQSL